MGGYFISMHTFKLNKQRRKRKQKHTQAVSVGSVHPLDCFGSSRGGGEMRDDSPETLFQFFLQEALVSNSGMGNDVHSLMLSVQHFLCRPWRRPFSNVPLRMVLERQSWRVTCRTMQCKFPSFDSCQKRFLWTHKEVEQDG